MFFLNEGQRSLIRSPCASISNTETYRSAVKHAAGGRFGVPLEKEMTVAQIAEAQRLSRDWKPRPHQGE